MKAIERERFDSKKKKMSKPKSFQGINVFMSRNLVPPEVFATLHDAVKDNGAQIHLCCDPSRNGPNDYHIISCSKHVIHRFHSQIAFLHFLIFIGDLLICFFFFFSRRNLKILNLRDVKCLVRVFSYRFL